MTQIHETTKLIVSANALPSINFNLDSDERIENRGKRITARLGYKDRTLGLYRRKCDGITKGIIEVKELRVKRVGDITSKEARLSGYSCVQDWINELVRIYQRPVINSDVVTLIRFEPVEGC